MFTNRKRVYSRTYAIYLDHGIVTWNSLLGLIHPALHHIIVWFHKVLLWEKNKQTNKSTKYSLNIQKWKEMDTLIMDVLYNEGKSLIWCMYPGIFQTYSISSCFQ